MISACIVESPGVRYKSKNVEGVFMKCEGAGLPAPCNSA